MLRIIRRMAVQDGESYVLLSPSKEQVARQKALEVGGWVGGWVGGLVIACRRGGDTDDVD